jgi:hypothetical protein
MSTFLGGARPSGWVRVRDVDLTGCRVAAVPPLPDLARVRCEVRWPLLRAPELGREQRTFSPSAHNSPKAPSRRTLRNVAKAWSRISRRCARAEAVIMTGDAAIVTGDAAIVTGDAAVVTGDAAVVTGDAVGLTKDAFVVTKGAVPRRDEAFVGPTDAFA